MGHVGGSQTLAAMNIVSYVNILFLSGTNVQECGCWVFHRVAVSLPPLQRNKTSFSKEWFLPAILIVTVCVFSLSRLPRSLTSGLTLLLAFLHSGWELLLPGGSPGSLLRPSPCSAT